MIPSVLLVDDDLNFRNTLSKILLKKGYEVMTAESGYQALDYLRERDFGVVLMDIKMPVLNGVEAFKKVKVLKPGLPVILMTAYSMEDLVKEAVKEGVYSVLRKPFDAETVIRMIEKCQSGGLVAVVDDDPNFTRTMKSVLEKKGYGVTAFQSGKEALDSALHRPHDIFLLDLKMPVLNGLETYLEIRNINPRAVVILVTGHGQDMRDLIDMAVEEGVYRCLYKPFEMSDVLELIDEIFEKKKQEPR